MLALAWRPAELSWLQCELGSSIISSSNSSCKGEASRRCGAGRMAGLQHRLVTAASSNMRGGVAREPLARAQAAGVEGRQRAEEG